jgi:hypothetical protein
VYKNSKDVRKETDDHPIFIGPMFLHWEGSFLTYNTFFAHIKARMQESIERVQLRIGSDDEGDLTKALDNVFPTAQRLLCTKHIQDNVSDHLKNSIGVKDTERSEILDSIFGQSGLVDSTECGLSFVWLIRLNQYFTSEKWLKHSVSICLQDQHRQTWHMNIDTGSKTLNYRLFKNKFEFKNYFNILDDRDRFTFCRFRLNNHTLPVEYG